jgi:hypothetical protein
LDRWKTWSKKIEPIIVEIEQKAYTDGLIERRTRSRRVQLKNVVLSCIVHRSPKIYYTRGNAKGSYKDLIDMLEAMGLLTSHSAPADRNGKVGSYFEGYQSLVKRFKGLPAPKAYRTTIIVRKKIGDDKITLKHSEIKNQSKLKQLESEMASYNDLLDKHPVIHPFVDEKMPMRFFRVFNGGSFRANQGGRYYSRHPAFWTKNSIAMPEGGKPRDYIEVEYTDSNGNKDSAKTVSYDFTALHLNLLYLHSTGKTYSHRWIYENPVYDGGFESTSTDPYSIAEDSCEIEMLTKDDRGIMKMVSMCVLGSGSPLATLKEIVINQHNKKYREYEEEAMWDEYYAAYAEFGSMLITLGDNWEKKCKEAVDDYKEHHKAVLSRYRLNKKLPLVLQHIDSILMTNIIKRLTAMKVPCYPWHDEVLIPYLNRTKAEALELLTTVCEEEFSKLIGGKVLGELDKFLKKKVSI